MPMAVKISQFLFFLGCSCFMYLRVMTFDWRMIVPQFLLQTYRKWKRNQRNLSLDKQRITGDVKTFESLRKDFIDAGLHKGSHVMVHASLSKIGYIEGGAETLIRALKETIGHEGIILMPTSPISKLQLDYALSNPIFDVRSTPSAMGKISEVFRTSEGVVRSLHPTEPIAAWGNSALEYVKDHEAGITPYHEASPYRKLMKNKGVILYIGVSLDNAGTHLHTLEDALDVKLPVYHDTVFKLNVISYSGEKQVVETKVHNPEQSRKRRCDELLPMFLAANVYHVSQIGDAKTLVFDAEKMFDCMVKNYKEKEITMYNPKGNQ